MTNRNQPTGSGRGSDAIDPRNGAPKNATGAAPAHPGMRHTVAPNVTIGGASKTEVARLLGNDAIGEVHGGGETNTALPKPSQQAQGNVAVNPGTKGC
jgi:hypothetical protein